MNMAAGLAAIHEDVAACHRCVPSPLSPSQNVRRSGFPAKNRYIAMIVGAEPGPRARGHLSPEDYLLRFTPGYRDRNKARLIFEDLEKLRVDRAPFFFTNAVKCSATKAQAHECFAACRTFLDRQVRAINPRFMVVIGTAASYMGVPRAGADSIRSSAYSDIPVISVRHPQGATMFYRRRVVEAIREQLKVAGPN